MTENSNVKEANKTSSKDIKKDIKKNTFILIILDGFGVRVSTQFNGPKLAKMPFYNSLFEKYPHTTIEASHHFVGLPDGQMGTSEVGHLNIGSGRKLQQETTRISLDITSGEFFKNKAFLSAIEHVKKNNSALHLFGLVSEGGVHSDTEHLYSLIELAKKQNVPKLFIHAFLDGRDTPPSSAKKYIDKLKNHIKGQKNIHISTISGRYYAMDRDKRWDRIQKAYETMTGIKIESVHKTTDKLIKASYDKKITDEFVLPSVIDCNDEDQFVGDNDSVIFFNFRPDRAREITRAFVDDNFDGFARKKIKNLKYVCITEYDIEIKNVEIAYAKIVPKNTLAEYLSNLGKTQLHTAETEKYAHVTFFFNGGLEKQYPGEERLLVPSPKVATYDLKPEMSAIEVTDGLLKAISSQKYDFIVVNYANPDMVGHTGKLDAVIKALECIDGCLSKVITLMDKLHVKGILISDHGNCDQMAYADGSPHTAHTTNKVPFILFDSDKELDLKKTGALCDVAPSILEEMNISKPKEMTGESMIIHLK
ncbi:MAG: 2,3-bisphosphoglycerate-independent phosphoglycerate mutase [Candidatus Woesearchaeota archaeon]